MSNLESTIKKVLKESFKDYSMPEKRMWIDFLSNRVRKYGDEYLQKFFELNNRYEADDENSEFLDRLKKKHKKD